MTHSLGRWAVIDIETSGVDPYYDSIIDLGITTGCTGAGKRQYKMVSQLPAP